MGLAGGVRAEKGVAVRIIGACVSSGMAGRCRGRRRRGLGLLVALLALSTWVAVQAAEAEPLSPTRIERGMPLVEALRILESRGLTIVYTSELVEPEMVVSAAPAAEDPRRVLAELLSPHGLEVREDRGILVVVATLARPVRGIVLESSRGRPLAGALVRWVGSGSEVATAEDGSFSLEPRPPGRYGIEASAAAHIDQRLEVVIESAVEPPPLVVRLQRQPFVHDEIVVRPSRLSLLLEQPNTTFSLGREEMDSVPQLGGDLFRTASLFPGVAANDVSAQFSVHGGRRDEVRVVLDGQELYDAYHLKDYDSALSLVPARTLADAQLTTGSYSVNHGDRMSAVLDLRTVEPSSGRQVFVGLGVLDFLVSGSGRFAKERAGWLVAARRGSLDFAADAIGDEKPRFWDVHGKVDLTTSRGSLSGHLLASGDELELDSRDEDGFEVFENNYENSYAWVNHQRTIGPRLLVGTIGSWARIRRNRGGEGLEEEGGFELSDRRDLEVLGLAQRWSLDLGAHHAVDWGGELRRYNAYFDYAKNVEPEFVIIAPFALERPTVHEFEDRLRGEHAGLWASDRVSLSERLTAEVGLRFDHHGLTDDEVWSPRFNLAWRQGQRTVVRAAWGVYHQTQRPYELQVEDGESRLASAERSEHWLLGAESLLAANRLGLEALRVELFRREVENPRARSESLLEPLNFFPEIEPDRVRIEPDRAHAQGIELLLRGRGGPRFVWWLAYSVARAEDRLEGRQVPRALDQRHTVTLDANYRLRRWNVNAAWRYHTGWPTTPVASELVSDPEEPGEGPVVVPVFGDLNSERLPAYHRLDLRASRSWGSGSGSWTFFVDIQNVYNRKNLAGFDVRIDDGESAVHLDREDWSGVFPSIGVTWAFPGPRTGGATSSR